jgi:hypothetical protein
VVCGSWPARESLSVKNNDSHFRPLTETCPPSFTIIRLHDALGNRQCLVPNYRSVLLFIRQKVYRGANADIGGFAVPSLARRLSKKSVGPSDFMQVPIIPSTNSHVA